MEGGRMSPSGLREAVRSELEALARLAALRPDLRVVEGADGTGWRICVETGEMIVDGADLAGRPPEFLAAITLHECAHSTLTRTNRIVPHEILRNPVEFQLINVMEDGRIESWLADWLPGCGPWLASTQAVVASEHFRVRAGEIGRIPAADFCMALVFGRHGIALPAPIHPAAAAAVAETAGAVERYFDCWPRLDVLERRAGECAARYTAGPLPALFAAEDAGIAPSWREMAARQYQYRAWSILHREIRPAYLRLVEMTPSVQAQLDFNAFMADLVSQLSGRLRHAPHGSGPLGGLRVVGRRANGHAGGGLPGAAAVGNSGRSGRALRDRFSREIADLSDRLLRMRRDRGRMKWRRGQPDGQRPDLRAAMEFSATGRESERLWIRRSLPHRIAPAVVLLADCSSSMDGAKSEAAHASAVILREACRRAGLPLAVLGYNTGACRLAEFHEGKEADGRLDAVGQPAGGTRIVPALEEADAVMEAGPYREHLVLVMADGEFHHCERDGFDRVLCRWKTRAVRVRGLGLGPETAGMADWFPGDPVGIGPADLPRTVAGMLEDFIGDLYGRVNAA